MMTYNFIISPETIKSDLINLNISGTSVGVYSGMSQIISSGPKGFSTLTGLTIPILLTETVNDFGYYEPFDGGIFQQDTITNFIFSSTTTNPYRVYVYNTSSEFYKFLDLSNYVVYWGDGTSTIVTSFSPNFIFHDYSVTPKTYEIVLEQTNPWGKVNVKKEITLPYNNIRIFNPKGNIFFASNIGSWSATPINYNYIYPYDSSNILSAQTSNTFTTVPFFISGQTFSRLKDLEQYGPTKYKPVGQVVYIDNQAYGFINSITPSYTGYTIQGVDYYDYADGTSLFFIQSSGLTETDIVAKPISKREALINIIDQPIIQSNVFVERGKNSPYEKIQRLGEVDNLGDLTRYGYGFFKVEKKV